MLIMDLVQTILFLYHLGSIWFLFHDSSSELRFHYLLARKKNGKQHISCLARKSVEAEEAAKHYGCKILGNMKVCFQEIIYFAIKLFILL